MPLEKVFWNKLTPSPLFFLLIINFFVAISTGIAFSVSPFLITESLGLSVFVFGCIEGFCEFLANTMKLVSGGAIDRFKKKKTLLCLGLFLAVLSKPFLYFGKTISSIFLSKILERVSNGVIATSRDVLAAETSPKDQLGGAFGLMMTSKTLGCVIGSFLISLLSVFLPTLFLGQYAYFIFLSCIFSVLALGIAVFFIREIKPGNESSVSQNEFKMHNLFDLGKRYWGLIACVSLFMLGRFNDGLLIIYLKESGCPPAFYLSTIGIYNLVSLLSAYPVGKLLDYGKIRGAFCITILSLFAFNLCFLNPQNIWILLLGVVFWGVQRSSSQIVFVSTISKIVPLHRLGTALGFYYMISGVVSFFSAAVASSLAAYSYPLVFILSMAASLLSFIFLPKPHKLTTKPSCLKPQYASSSVS